MVLAVHDEGVTDHVARAWSAQLRRLFGTLLEHARRDRHGGHHVRPAGVEEQVHEHFRRFRFRQAVIHRAVQMKRDLRDLAEAMSALTVTRLRSRGASAGRRHRS